MTMICPAALEEVLRDDPLCYVDAGARCDLEQPWKSLPEHLLTVLAFEPDPSAPIDWEAEKRNWYLERCALWSREQNLTINIGEVASTSSVRPPNFDYLKRFSRNHVDPRRTAKTIEVPARTLDQVVEARRLKPDFLKIDTQGSELEIIKGGLKTLRERIFGVVVETWTAEIHVGQGVTADVMLLMRELGFELFQVEIGAAWHRRNFDRTPTSGSRQVVGLDLLYFRDPQAIASRFTNHGYTARCAAIAEFYGHYDLVLEILEIGRKLSAKFDPLFESLADKIIRHYAEQTRMVSVRASLWRRLRSLLGRYSRPVDGPAKLHY